MKTHTMPSQEPGTTTGSNAFCRRLPHRQKHKFLPNMTSAGLFPLTGNEDALYKTAQYKRSSCTAVRRAAEQLRLKRNCPRSHRHCWMPSTQGAAVIPETRAGEMPEIQACEEGEGWGGKMPQLSDFEQGERQTVIVNQRKVDIGVKCNHSGQDKGASPCGMYIRQPRVSSQI